MIPWMHGVGRRLSRREIVRGIGRAGLGALTGLGVGSAGCRLAGPERFGAVDPAAPGLGPPAKALVDACWRGIDRAACWDTHVHLVGLGTGGSGARVSDRMRDRMHLARYARYLVYRRAAGIEDESRADEQFVERLRVLKEDWNPQGKLLLLAFDEAHDEAGRPRPLATDFYTPNAWAEAVAGRYPEHFVWAASIHPYRRDAVSELERCATAGARAVKWLPNAQLMDAASPRCDAFYRRLAALGIPLIAHVGAEQAVDADEAQGLGNPLRFRRALDAGVRVIMAHVGSLGVDRDLDAARTAAGPGAGSPPGVAAQPEVTSFELVGRLFADPAYAQRLFADLSATIQVNRCETLRDVIGSPALHDRLLYASDYPLPAINVVVHLGKLVDLGYLAEADARLAGEIYEHNPLTFNFVLLRHMAVGGHRLSDAVFHTRRHFGV
jgi:mannonate dehydratase